MLKKWIFCALAISSLSHATASSKVVHVSFAPYAWASALSGNVSSWGRSAHFYVPFSEIFRHLQFAAQNHIEAGYGPITFMVDPTYLKLEDRRNRGLIRPHLISQTWLIDSGVFYRFIHHQVSENQWIGIEALGGARYLSVKNTLELPFDLVLATHADIAAPIVGGRFKADITPKAEFWLRADVGGWQSSGMQHTWSATVGLAYAIHPYIDLALAYRALKIDYAKSNSSSAMDVLLQGPMLGVAFHN